MNKLKIAIQKSGRLNKDSLELLGKCGIKIDNYKDQLKASSSNFPIEVYFFTSSVVIAILFSRAWSSIIEPIFI